MKGTLKSLVFVQSASSKAKGWKENRSLAQLLSTPPPFLFYCCHNKSSHPWQWKTTCIHYLTVLHVRHPVALGLKVKVLAGCAPRDTLG